MLYIIYYLLELILYSYLFSIIYKCLIFIFSGFNVIEESPVCAISKGPPVLFHLFILFCIGHIQFDY